MYCVAEMASSSDSDIPISIPTAGIGLKAAQAGVFVERLVPGRSADKVGYFNGLRLHAHCPELSTAHFFIVAVFMMGIAQPIYYCSVSISFDSRALSRNRMVGCMRVTRSSVRQDFDCMHALFHSFD
jgi:hypothetical protein